MMKVRLLSVLGLVICFSLPCLSYRQERNRDVDEEGAVQNYLDSDEARNARKNGDDYDGDDDIKSLTVVSEGEPGSKPQYYEMDNAAQPNSPTPNANANTGWNSGGKKKRRGKKSGKKSRGSKKGRGKGKGKGKGSKKRRGKGKRPGSKRRPRPNYLNPAPVPAPVPGVQSNWNGNDTLQRLQGNLDGGDASVSPGEHKICILSPPPGVEYCYGTSYDPTLVAYSKDTENEQKALSYYASNEDEE